MAGPAAGRRRRRPPRRWRILGAAAPVQVQASLHCRFGRLQPPAVAAAQAFRAARAAGSSSPGQPDGPLAAGPSVEFVAAGLSPWRTSRPVGQGAGLAIAPACRAPRRLRTATARHLAVGPAVVVPSCSRAAGQAAALGIASGNPGPRRPRRIQQGCATGCQSGGVASSVVKKAPGRITAWQAGWQGLHRQRLPGSSARRARPAAPGFGCSGSEGGIAGDRQAHRAGTLALPGLGPLA